MNTESLSWFKKVKKENFSTEFKTQHEEIKTPPQLDPTKLFNFFAPPHLYLKFTEQKGFGVFTKKAIKEGSVIETCYSIVLNWRQMYQRDQSITRYAYWHNCPCTDCEKHGSLGMIPLGYGCIYNSAESEKEKNATFHINANAKLITFTAVKNIKPDEEILTWWGENYFNSFCKPKKSNDDIKNE